MASKSGEEALRLISLLGVYPERLVQPIFFWRGFWDEDYFAAQG
jgi:hypothetical protein